MTNPSAKYNSDKIKKKSLIIVCQNLIKIDLNPIFIFFGLYTTVFFFIQKLLELAKLSSNILKKQFQLWQEI